MEDVLSLASGDLSGSGRHYGGHHGEYHGEHHGEYHGGHHGEYHGGHHGENHEGHNLYLDRSKFTELEELLDSNGERSWAGVGPHSKSPSVL